jgi:hypothetical protein
MLPRIRASKLSGKCLLSLAVFCWFAFLGLCPWACASETQSAKKILILFSYQSVTPGFLEWDEGIRSVLQGTAREPMEFYIEFLDLARFPDKIYLQDLVNFLQKKYSGKKLDLLIPVAPLAFHFLFEHGNTIFPDADSFCGALKMRCYRWNDRKLHRRGCLSMWQALWKQH